VTNKLTYVKLIGDLESIISMLEHLEEFEDADVLQLLRDKYLNQYLSMTTLLYGESHD
jgi:hypothetical protein